MIAYFSVLGCAPSIKHTNRDFCFVLFLSMQIIKRYMDSDSISKALLINDWNGFLRHSASLKLNTLNMCWAGGCTLPQHTHTPHTHTHIYIYIYACAYWLTKFNVIMQSINLFRMQVMLNILLQTCNIKNTGTTWHFIELSQRRRNAVTLLWHCDNAMCFLWTVQPHISLYFAP